MSAEALHTLGEALSAEAAAELMDARTRALHRACSNHRHYDVRGFQRVGDTRSVAVIVDVGDGSVASENPVGIRRRECLALYCPEGDPGRFEVRALRTDFPDVLHLNGVHAGKPKSLCLLQLDNDTIQRRYTAEQLLARILEWLELTAEDKLHQDDQGLEQVFYDTGQLILLPADLVELSPDPKRVLHVARAWELAGRVVVETSFVEPQAGAARPLQLRPLVVVVPPAGHGPVRRQPHRLGDLEVALQSLGSTLLMPLSDVVREASSAGATPSPPGEMLRVLLVLVIPRSRESGDAPSRWDTVGYVLDADLAGLGVALGVLQPTTPGGVAFPMQLIGDANSFVDAQSARSIAVSAVEVRTHMTRTNARAMAGIDAREGEFRGVLAGVGALGSALADYWTRSGWGRWGFIDPDVVEPHNLVRHLARRSEAGVPKVFAVRALTDAVYDDPAADDATMPGHADRLDHPDVRRVLEAANLLVDASTTLAVPREWAAIDALPRAASVFLTPSGRGCVLLLEDATRSIRGDALEAQYYRALIQHQWADGLLASAHALRSGAGCRDRSVVMATDAVHLHAALLSRRLRMLAPLSEATIEVWIADALGAAVTHHRIAAHPTQRAVVGGWTVSWDDGLLAALTSMREAALPNETGGVLFGVSDQKLRTVHLVWACAAPAGSVSSPTGFIRAGDVTPVREHVQARTGNMVDYVGEWHSHPDGCGALPSTDDAYLVASLAARLNADGLPAVMVIAGDGGEFSITLRQCGEVFAASP
jgi:hypothetical protein